MRVRVGCRPRRIPQGERNSRGVWPRRETSCPLRSAPHYIPPSALINTLLHRRGRRRIECHPPTPPPARARRPDNPRRPKEQGTSKRARTRCGQTSRWLTSQAGVFFPDNEEMRGRPGEASMHIALTLPLGPAIVFQLIAASLRANGADRWRGSLSGARRIVLTGGGWRGGGRKKKSEF